MQNISNNFQQIRKSKNPEEINDFLVKISKEPKVEYLNFIDYFINNLEPEILKKIQLNLVFALGQVGKVVELDEKYLIFLSKIYYTSDRWIRREIIEAFHNISKNTTLSDKIIELVGYALNDDYIPIKIEAQKILLSLKGIPNKILKNIFHTLNSNESEVINNNTKIFEKYFIDLNQLFTSLNQSENFKILRPQGIRVLLLICFKSLMKLEAFREKIINSKWSDTSRKLYLKQIETYESILLKNL
ncbi:MAG: hypothetical protein ACFFHD_13615 [Promethearchaeota archaeon]